MDSLVSRSISIILAVGIGCELARGGDHSFAQGEQVQANSASLHSRFVDKCCQVGRERAIESAKFNCKLTTREVLASLGQVGSDRASQLLALSAESLVAREPNFADQCEMVLESCCLAHHRTRNCNSGKQFAKSGSACMDVELSKEATVATESFNDCCMSCSLGILAARTPTQNDSSSPPPPATQSRSTTRLSSNSLNDRCKLISPLASSMSGQLYEQTYIECCQENLPRPSSALIFDSNAPIDCSQVANACSQRCLSSGSLDPITRQPIEQDRCDCFTGYKLGPDGVSCTDIDECKQNLHTCNRQSEVCDNTRGSFRCLARAQQQQQQQQHHQQHHQPTRLLSSSALDEYSSVDPASAAALALTGEQPFASLRLCPPGSRWLAAQNRCQPAASGDNHNQQQHQQHHWKRNAAYSSASSSSSTLSSSRRASGARTD